MNTPSQFDASSPPERFLDELEAVQVASAWIERIGTRLYQKGPTSLDRQTFGHLGGAGGVIICWHGVKLAAVATIFRDQLNWSRLVRWINPELLPIINAAESE